MEAGGGGEHPLPGVGGGEFGEAGHEELVGGVEAVFPGWCGRVARSPKGPGVCGGGGGHGSGRLGLVADAVGRVDGALGSGEEVAAGDGYVHRVDGLAGIVGVLTG